MSVKPTEIVHVGTASGPVMLDPGEDYDEDHRVVKAHPELFTAPEPRPEPPAPPARPRKATPASPTT